MNERTEMRKELRNKIGADLLRRLGLQVTPGINAELVSEALDGEVWTPAWLNATLKYISDYKSDSDCDVIISELKTAIVRDLIQRLKWAAGGETMAWSSAWLMGALRYLNDTKDENSELNDTLADELSNLQFPTVAAKALRKKPHVHF